MAESILDVLVASDFFGKDSANECRTRVSRKEVLQCQEEVAPVVVEKDEDHKAVAREWGKAVVRAKKADSDLELEATVSAPNVVIPFPISVAIHAIKWNAPNAALS